MWAIGSLRVKVHNPEYLFPDYEKYKSRRCDIFENGYLKIGNVIVANPTINNLNVHKFLDNYNKDPQIYFPMGLPFPSMEGEVLKFAPHLSAIESIESTSADIIMDVDKIKEVFDVSSFVCNPTFNNNLIKKIAEYILTPEIIINILWLCSFGFKDLMNPDYLQYNNIGDRSGEITSFIVKMIPISGDKNKRSYSDFIFSRMFHGDARIPAIIENGIGIVPFHQDNYTNPMIRMGIKNTLILIMERGTCTVSQLMGAYPNKLHENPLIFENDFNMMIYFCLLAIMRIHRFGVIHGDYHTSNIIVDFIDDPNENEYFRNQYNRLYSLPSHCEAIDFGRTFYYDESDGIYKCDVLWEIYFRGEVRFERHTPEWIDEHRSKFSHRDDQNKSDSNNYAIISTLLDLVSLILSLKLDFSHIEKRMNPEITDKNRKIMTAAFESTRNKINHMENWVADCLDNYVNGPFEKIFDIRGGYDSDDWLEAQAEIAEVLANARKGKIDSVSFVTDPTQLPIYHIIDQFYGEYNLKE